MIKKIFGVQTHYQHIGKHKHPLILLHGWGCNWEIWSPIITQLSEKYQLIIPDLPSLGKSETPNNVWTSAEFALWLKNFVDDTVGDQNFSLLGHSFGGKIAAIYAAKNPSKISHLILVDASGLPDALNIKKQVQEKMFSLVPSVLKESIPESVKKKFAKLTASSVDYRNANQYQRLVLKKIFKEDLTTDAQKIKTPTLILWGKNDHDTPLHQGKKYHELIMNSQLEIFEHSGHFPFIDESNKFIEVLQKFLS